MPRRRLGVHRTVRAFGSVTAAYEAGRPSYPEPALAWLSATAGIGPGCDVLDLGAGTGKLTRLLVEPANGKADRIAPLSYRTSPTYT
jgi:hypothetical protein